jgi:phosphohistidine phosphatase
MKLLVVRHAIAEDREAYAASGHDDALRPLTEQGARRMKRGARGLRHLVPAIDTLVASPFTRAIDTAEIVRREYGIDRVETNRALEPTAAVADAVAALQSYKANVVAIFGHEPQLGRLVTYLISGLDRSAIDLKKGSACLIEFDGNVSAGTGTLIWSIRPRMLRRLAD